LVLTRPIILLSILILGTAFFLFFIPIVPVSQSCRNLGCAGPEYESLGYILFGVGETITLVGPNTPYGSVALVVSALFVVAIGYGIFPVLKQLGKKKEPSNPK